MDAGSSASLDRSKAQSWNLLAQGTEVRIAADSVNSREHSLNSHSPSGLSSITFAKCCEHELILSSLLYKYPTAFNWTFFSLPVGFTRQMRQRREEPSKLRVFQPTSDDSATVYLYLLNTQRVGMPMNITVLYRFREEQREIGIRMNAIWGIQRARE